VAQGLDDGPGADRGHAPGALGQDDVAGRQVVDAHQTEPGPEMGRDGGGGEDGRAVALEGERGQQTDAVELDPGRSRTPAGFTAASISARKAVPGAGSRSSNVPEVGEGDLLGPDQGSSSTGTTRTMSSSKSGSKDEVATGNGKGEDGHVEASRRQLGLEARGGAVGHHQIGGWGGWTESSASSTGVSQRAVVPRMPTRTVPPPPRAGPPRRP
jgi:hypothetical protein